MLHSRMAMITELIGIALLAPNSNASCRLFIRCTLTMGNLEFLTLFFFLCYCDSQMVPLTWRVWPLQDANIFLKHGGGSSRLTSWLVI